MIGLIGIFVITSSAGLRINYFSERYTYTKYEQFIRVSTSSNVSDGEIARPVCFWINHKWVEKVFENDRRLIELYQQCLYCEKKRVKKEVWEDVK